MSQGAALLLPGRCVQGSFNSDWSDVNLFPRNTPLGSSPALVQKPGWSDITLCVIHARVTKLKSQLIYQCCSLNHETKT